MNQSPQEYLPIFRYGVLLIHMGNVKNGKNQLEIALAKSDDNIEIMIELAKAFMLLAKDEKE